MSQGKHVAKQSIALSEEYLLARKLVGTFTRILNKTLSLTPGSPCALERNKVNSGIVLKTDLSSEKEATLMRRVEKLLAYATFSNDTSVLKAFSTEHSRRIVQVAKAHKIVDLCQKHLTEVLDAILMVLEGYRVRSLWGAIYPGSYLEVLQEELFNALDIFERCDDDDFGIGDYFLTIALGRGMEEDSSEYARLRPILEEALSMVYKSTVEGTLLSGKWLFTQLIDDLVRDSQGKPPRDAAQEGLVDEAKQQLQEQGLLNDDNEDRTDESSAALSASLPVPLSGDAKERFEALKELLDDAGTIATYPERLAPEHQPNSLDKSQRDLLEDALRQSASKEDEIKKKITHTKWSAEKDLDALKQRLSKAKTSATDVLKKDTLGTINIETLLKPTFSVLADPQVEATIKKLRLFFRRVKDRRVRRLRDEGLNIDTSAVIQNRISGRSEACFYHEVRDTGFHVTLLVDLSQSMTGSKIQQVDIALRTLLPAMDFPSVTVDVYGFRMNYYGTTDLFKIEHVKGVSDIRKAVAGGTPLDNALAVVSQMLKNKNNSKHILILTDGAPENATKQQTSYHPHYLQDRVRKSVNSSRKHGCSVTTLVVGSQTGDSVAYSVSEESLNRMFGSSKHWSFVDPRHLQSTLLDTAKKCFTGYLRRM